MAVSQAGSPDRVQFVYPRPGLLSVSAPVSALVGTETVVALAASFGFAAMVRTSGTSSVPPAAIISSRPPSEPGSAASGTTAVSFNGVIPSTVP